MPTNYTYITGIPAANNNPSNDQPNMQTNTNSINSIISTDHYSFGTAPTTADGAHKQITYDANNVPSLPTPTNSGNNIGYLFTNAVAGTTVNQLFYYAGSNVQSSTQYNVGNSSNGSTFLFGGTILKWGSFTSAAGSTTVTYSTLTPALAAFPNNTLAVIISPNSSLAQGRGYVSSFNQTSFTVSSTVNANQYTFIAIGY
jgi:hypothetical protein